MMDTKIGTLVLLQFFSLSIFGQNFYKGVDLSYVNELEACEATYKDRSGVMSDPYELFQKEGANMVRLRLWHNPTWTGYSNFEDIKISIARAKSAGMTVMLDFHYSDFWTDPGRQWRPGAWEDIVDDKILEDSVYNYTEKVLTELYGLDLIPDFVQIGNETNGNILLPRNGAAIDSGSPGLYPLNWPRQVGLLQRGIDAVNDLNLALEENMKIIIHVANPIDATSWFPLAISNGLSGFDIIGLSYYPQWHGLGVRELGEYVANLKNQHQKDIMIVEIGYPWTTSNGTDNANNVLGFESRLFTYSNTFSVETQRDFLIELTWLVKENGGLGVVYWEPAWISTSCETYWGTGSHWENATLFDFDGKIHAGADFLSHDYSQMPEALANQEVTFLVDVTAIDTEKGVYVTGDFTGSPWALLPMTVTESNLYKLETTIPGRTTGAYIFYNDNELENENRELVPELCAKLWDTHREYRIQGEDDTFQFSWGRCDQIPNVITFSANESSPDIFLYPTITENNIIINGIRDMEKLQLFNTSGKEFSVESIGENEYTVSHLPVGIYLIQLMVKHRLSTLKFVKR